MRPLVFQSTPPARGATRCSGCSRCRHLFISIHAPARGATPSSSPATSPGTIFQSTPPRGGATCVVDCNKLWRFQFQSTPPRGGRRRWPLAGAEGRRFQSTPPARGATYSAMFKGLEMSMISIHAPREGGDAGCWLVCTLPIYFNPRPPRGGRRNTRSSPVGSGYFNPRPPRGGRLSWSLPYGIRLFYFNPRPPRGGRRSPPNQSLLSARFQSTPPARGATVKVWFDAAPETISIHAPREGGDAGADGDFGGGTEAALFQSTPPARGATANQC